MSQYIDTHIHVDFLETPEALLAEARQAGVGAWVVPGTSRERWPEVMAMVARYAGVYAAPGVHPQAAQTWRPAHVEELRRLLQHPRVVALGEVGLDRQADSPWPVQEAVFRQMIALARESGRPLLLHSRRATGRLLELLNTEGASEVGGIAHAFSGSLETARRLIAGGFALGIGGVVTFPEARRLKEVVRSVPAEWLVLETDAPDLPPYPCRGQANRPAWLTLVAAEVGELRGWSAEETAHVTSRNARRVLRLPNAEDLVTV